jgi:hypothetical protein
MEYILSAIFMLQNHHYARSPSRTANVKLTGTWQIGYSYVRVHGIDKPHTTKMETERTHNSLQRL